VLCSLPLLLAADVKVWKVCLLQLRSSLEGMALAADVKFGRSASCCRGQVWKVWFLHLRSSLEGMVLALRSTQGREPTTGSGG
jgi:hypothetical protein